MNDRTPPWELPSKPLDRGYERWRLHEPFFMRAPLVTVCTWCWQLCEPRGLGAFIIEEDSRAARSACCEMRWQRFSLGDHVAATEEGFQDRKTDSRSQFREEVYKKTMTHV